MAWYSCRKKDHLFRNSPMRVTAGQEEFVRPQGIVIEHLDYVIFGLSWLQNPGSRVGFPNRTADSWRKNTCCSMELDVPVGRRLVMQESFTIPFRSTINISIKTVCSNLKASQDPDRMSWMTESGKQNTTCRSHARWCRIVWRRFQTDECSWSSNDMEKISCEHFWASECNDVSWTKEWTDIWHDAESRSVSHRRR